MKNIYFVGAPTQDKGLEDFAYISDNCKNVKLYWFTYNITDQLINKYKNINFIVGLDDNNLRNYIKNKMDIFISCSYAEGFCLPIAEAMLLEKPVLSYALEEVQSVYSNMIEYVTCFDKKEFTQKLELLITQNNKTTNKKYTKAKKYIEDNYLPDIVSSRLLKYIL
jgi:glycosyltransferase involved in cell wall biosynthesis